MRSLTPSILLAAVLALLAMPASALGGLTPVAPVGNAKVALAFPVFSWTGSCPADQSCNAIMYIAQTGDVTADGALAPTNKGYTWKQAGYFNPSPAALAAGSTASTNTTLVLDRPLVPSTWFYQYTSTECLHVNDGMCTTVRSAVQSFTTVPFAKKVKPAVDASRVYHHMKFYVSFVGNAPRYTVKTKAEVRQKVGRKFVWKQVFSKTSSATPSSYFTAKDVGGRTSVSERWVVPSSYEGGESLRWSHTISAPGMKPVVVKRTGAVYRD